MNDLKQNGFFTLKTKKKSLQHLDYEEMRGREKYWKKYTDSNKNRLRKDLFDAVGVAGGRN